jgi:hypothetical protein
MLERYYKDSDVLHAVNELKAILRPSPSPSLAPSGGDTGGT